MKITGNHNATQEVFELVLARPVTSPDLQHGRLIHVLWLAPNQGDRLVQFYVNGQLFGVSHSTTQREAWLVVDHEQAIEIELLAVHTSSAAINLSSKLAGIHPATNSAVALRLLRDVALLADSNIEIAVDGEVSGECSTLFSASDPRSGFGAVFGEGGFGYDAAIGPGLGRGELGYGPLGSDGTTLQWRGDTLPSGTHTIEVSLRDATGLIVAAGHASDQTIDRLPAPPTAVALNALHQLTWE